MGSRSNRADEPGAVLQAAVDQVLEEAKREALARAAAQLEPGQQAAQAEAHEAEEAEAERPAPLDPEELLRQAEEDAGIGEVWPQMPATRSRWPVDTLSPLPHEGQIVLRRPKDGLARGYLQRQNLFCKRLLARKRVHT